MELELGAFPFNSEEKIRERLTGQGQGMVTFEFQTIWNISQFDCALLFRVYAFIFVHFEYNTCMMSLHDLI